MRRRILALLLLGSVGAPGCRSSEGSVTLIYPAEYPSDAIKLLDVFTIKREDLAVADVSCESILAKAGETPEPAGAERVDVPLAPPFEGRTIEKFPRGNPIIFITGYNDSGEVKKPVIVGCTEEFDSSGGANVEIPLEVLIPVDTRVLKAAGDLQVTGAAGALPQALCVLVDATTAQLRDQRYGLPGIRVQFKPGPQVALGDQPAGQMVELVTQANGQACIPASLPAEAGYFEVEVVAPELFATRPQKEAASKATFLLSGVAPVSFGASPVSFTPGVPGRPVALDAGDVDGDGFADLAVLSCEGSEAGCRRGIAAEPPLGTAHLALYSNALDTRRETTRLGLGPAPSGLSLGRFSSLARADVAVLNGRSEACVNRAQRPCENSELRFLSWQGDALVDAGRITITASNAVGLSAMPALSGSTPSGYDSLVAAGQGRRENTQPCKLNVCLPFDPFCAHPQCLAERPCDCSGGECRCGAGEACFAEDGKNLCRPVKRTCSAGEAGCQAPPACDCEGGSCACPQGLFCFQDEATPRCYPYESACRKASECGCPAGEMCECPQEQGCAADATLGLCQGRDKEIEVLHNRGGTRFESREACTRPFLSCAKTGTGRPMTSCTCEDNPGVANCTGRDDCGCAVPNRITLTGRGVTPHGVGAGVLRENGVEFVVATAGGLDFIAKGTGENYAWADRPVVNAPIHGVKAVDLDGDVATDLVWYAQAPCAEGPNLQRQCPLVEPVGIEPGASPKGCFGVYLRYVDPSKPRPSDSPISAARSCRRFALADAPSDMCVGDFNGDGNVDVALSSAETSEVLVLAGDGRGGLLYPAQKVPLPSRGGVLSCADLNDDGLTDLAVASRESGVVVLIESRRSR